MNSKETKRLVEDTEKAFQEKKKEEQIKLIKDIVQKTLEKIEDIDKEIKDLEEKKRILRLDIDDLKAGKLDLLLERQSKDQKAKETSIIVIKEVIKEKEFVPFRPDTWYKPYYVEWNVPKYMENQIWCNTSSTNTSGFAGGFLTHSCGDNVTINASVAKDNVPGAYTISGHTINLR